MLNRRWLAEHDLRDAPHSEELSDPAGLITGRGGRIYIAERRGVVAGTCAVVPGADDAMAIRWLAVDPDWQRLGIGRRLLTRCAGYARRHGAPKLIASTSSRLSTGLRLYRKFGFIDAALPPGRRAPIDDVYMELELVSAAEPLRLIHSATRS